jgi:hypothetical protein
MQVELHQPGTCSRAAPTNTMTYRVFMRVSLSLRVLDRTALTEEYSTDAQKVTLHLTETSMTILTRT